MIYVIQISGIIHELGHFSQTKQIENEDYIVINNKFYIPYIGYIWSDTIKIVSTNIIDRLRFGLSGFLFQFLYLTIMTLIVFKGCTLVLSIVLFGFNCYLFIYASMQYNKNTSDFINWSNV